MGITIKWLSALAVAPTFLLTVGCGQDEPPERNMPPSVQTSEGASTPAEGAAALEPAKTEEREPLFPNGIAYFEGTDKLDSLEGGNVPALFKKYPSSPYGLYIYETMREIDSDTGFAWGTETPRTELALLDPKDVKLETNYVQPTLSKYAEYAGTLKEDGMYTDYLLLADRGNELMIRLRYAEEQLETALPALLDSARSIRYVSDPAAFKPGMEIEFPQGESEEEAEIYRIVRQSLEAIAARNLSAFRDTLQTPDVDYFDFFFDQESQYRFVKLLSPVSGGKDDSRASLAVEYEVLYDGIVHLSNHTVSLLKDRDGRWYVANID